MTKLGNIQEQYIKVKDNRMEPTIALKYKIFYCTNGFGCHPECIGTKVYATQIATGTKDFMRRSDVERLATKNEINLAKGE